ncbi:hypothetical protein [Xanthomonas sp. NCPPB 2632]|uniref:hypothetical protein n=1 Tax=Xanthomonas sp. NCPPB 2632 TaxID=3240912 RepID=UPI00351414A2
MPLNEFSILHLASIIQDTIALSQAVLDGDVAEARVCADRGAVQARAGGLAGVAHTALLVIDCLSQADQSTGYGCASAIEALSVETDQAQTRQLT